jgi:hypothetical protein
MNEGRCSPWLLPFHWRTCLTLALFTMLVSPALGGGRQASTRRASTRQDVDTLRVAAAEARLAAARHALEAVRKRREAGTASEQEVTEAQAAAAAAERALAEAKLAMAPRLVNLELKNAPIGTALAQLFSSTGQSYTLAQVEGEQPRVTLALHGVPFDQAVAAVAELAGLDQQRRDGVWELKPRATAITVGGGQVPVLGAVHLPDAELAGAYARASEELRAALAARGVPTQPESPPAAPGSGPRRREQLLSIPGGDTLVDLDVKDAPLAEVAARLSQAVQEKLDRQADEERKFRESAGMGGGQIETQVVQIIVADAASDLKVTARVSKWPVNSILSMILDRTNLTSTIERIEPPRASRLAERPTGTGGPLQVVPTTFRLYLVPMPFLEVTGPGAISGRPSQTGRDSERPPTAGASDGREPTLGPR